jgi:hypothetical protein
LVTVQGQIFHGKSTCSNIISKHSIEMTEESHNWDNEFREVCECFLNRLFASSESVNVFFITYLYEWTLWIFVFIVGAMNGIGECFLYCMNGLFECFLNHWFKWMESLNVVFIICWHEWNLWMLFSLSVDMNGICKCVYYLFM